MDSERAIYKPGRELSPRTESAITLILDFSASKTVRSKCVWFKPLSVWDLVMAAPDA